MLLIETLALYLQVWCFLIIYYFTLKNYQSGTEIQHITGFCKMLGSYLQDLLSNQSPLE